MTPAPLVIAHRGGAAEAPENTLAAFRRALDLGCDGIECDVRLSHDGKAVIHHDPRIRAGAHPWGRWTVVEQEDEATLRRFDLAWTHGEGFEGQRIPTLDSFLGLPLSGVIAMIEIKPDSPVRALAGAVAASLKAHPRRSDCRFGSFSAELLGHLHRADPALRLVAVVKRPDQVATFSGLPIEGWALKMDLALPDRVAELKAAGGWVWAWTVKTAGHVAPLLEAGVDGLITDCPGATLRHLGREPR